MHRHWHFVRYPFELRSLIYELRIYFVKIVCHMYDFYLINWMLVKFAEVQMNDCVLSRELYMFESEFPVTSMQASNLFLSPSSSDPEHYRTHSRPSHLTHWGRDKIAISQRTFSKAVSFMIYFEIRSRLHRSLFLRFELTIFQHCFR